MYIWNNLQGLRIFSFKYMYLGTHWENCPGRICFLNLFLADVFHISYCMGKKMPLLQCSHICYILKFIIDILYNFLYIRWKKMKNHKIAFSTRSYRLILYFPCPWGDLLAFLREKYLESRCSVVCRTAQ